MRRGGGKRRIGRQVLGTVAASALFAGALTTCAAAQGWATETTTSATAAPATPSPHAKSALGAGKPTADESVSVAGTERLGSGDKGGGDSEVIVEVFLRRDIKLSGGLVAYLSGNDLLVPLNELMILLEFAISETPKGAEGWFLDEKRRFKLDLAAGDVVSDGKSFRLKPTDAKRIEKELFVSARSLSEWLPLNFYANMKSLSLHINPRGQVPMEERQARTKSKFGSIHQFRSTLPHQETPYQIASIPGIEVDTATGYTTRRGGSLYNAGTLRMFGDLAYMNGELFVTGTDRGVSDARIRLGRSDPDGGLLGPLNATSFDVGDVGGVSAPLISGGGSGRGLRVTSRPGSYIAEFDRITLEDSLPVNWEVELYRNGILMDKRPPSSDGRYRFDNVPLLRGQNEIRLEFYGPQGQRKTDTRQYVVGEGQVPVGKFNYDVSLHEVGRSVFGFTNWVRYNQLYENQAFGGGARFDYGLTRNVSLTGGVFAQPLPTRTRELGGDDYRYYGTLGARTMIGNFGVAVDTAVDDQGGVAAGASVSTTVGEWNIAARHEQFMNEFASDASYGASAALRRYTYRTSNSTARADTTIGKLWPGVYMTTGFTAGYTTYDNSDATWRVGNSLGLSAGRFSFSNDLNYGGAVTGGRDGIFGSARVNYRLFDGVSIRASTDYDLRDLAEVDGYSVRPG